jgi:hypothetical protein
MIPSPEISYNFLRCRGPGLIYDWTILELRLNCEINDRRVKY